MKNSGDYTLKDYLNMDASAQQKVLRELTDKELVFLHWQVLSGKPGTEASGSGSDALCLLDAVVTAEEAKRFEHEVLKSHKKFRKKIQKSNTDTEPDPDSDPEKSE